MPPPRPAAFILNLPFDLTSDIFERVSAHPSYPTIRDIYPKDFVPLRLAAVCTEWRSVALSTPTLWATLILDCTTIHQADAVSVVDTWLSRAGEAPLTLYIRLALEYPNYVVSRLALYAQRWKRVHLEAYGWSLLMDSIPRELEMLEYLGLYGSAAVSMGKTLGEMNAPRLREVSVDSYSFFLHRGLPVHQLTTLELGSLTVDDSVKVLKQTPNLQTLRLYLTIDDESSQSIDPNPLSLHHLTTLQLLEPTWQPPIALMSHLTLPSLTHTLLDGRGMTDANHSIIQSFVERSAFSLQELTVQNTTVGAISEAAMIFPSLPALVLFPPAVPPPPQRIRDIFTLEVPPLFCELRSLTIGRWGRSSESNDTRTLLALIDLVSVRSAGLNGAVKLKSFTFDSHGMSEAVLRRHAAELKALVDECGEDFSLNFGGFTTSVGI
ncbi:hypothetical protein C8F01DRAFT_1097818 [Mycena amicta]|nr:hypothetical protein C8F01DRAFT_1097818 [Mycena amicta]